MTYLSSKLIYFAMPNRVETEVELTSSEKETLLKHFPKGITAFDLEMTGLSPVFDKIIEIAGIKLTESGKITTFQTLVNPLISVPEHTIQYHGLTNDDLNKEKTLKYPLKDFLEFVGDSPLVAHNGIFDSSFLFVGMNEYKFKPSLSSIFDTCKLSRHLFKHKSIETKPENHKLETLANFFKLDFSHHMALDDSAICLKIMAKLLEIMETHSLEKNFRDWAYLFKLNSFENPSEYILSKKIMEIKGLVQAQTPFEIRYKGGSIKDNFRPIKPLSLLALPKGLVLYAECQKTQMNKYFRVKKIQKIRAFE